MPMRLSAMITNHADRIGAIQDFCIIIFYIIIYIIFVIKINTQFHVTIKICNNIYVFLVFNLNLYFKGWVI